MNRTIFSRRPDGLPSPAAGVGVGVGRGVLLRGPTGEWANPGPGRDQGFVPYSEEPIRYLSDRVNDPVARLQDRIDRGLARLDFEAEHGYLKSVLKQLDVAVSTQTLVFSKSSFQYRKISPQTPRALYYNDNVYVGWVQDGHSLEIASFDPNQGAIFYLLEQRAVGPSRRSSARPLIAPSATSPPGRGECPAFWCDQSTPGPRAHRQPTPARTSADSRAPLAERWGGWYVTGTHGKQTHMGNVLVSDREHPEKLDTRAGGQCHGPLRQVRPVSPGPLPYKEQRPRRPHGAGTPGQDAQPDHPGQLPGQDTLSTTHGDQQGTRRAREHDGSRNHGPAVRPGAERIWSSTCSSSTKPPLSEPVQKARPRSRRNSQPEVLAIARDGRYAISISRRRLFEYPLQLPDLLRRHSTPCPLG